MPLPVISDTELRDVLLMFLYNFMAVSLMHPEDSNARSEDNTEAVQTRVQERRKCLKVREAFCR